MYLEQHSPLISAQAAATGSDPTSSVDQLVSAFGSSTKSFGHSSASGINIDLVVGVGAGIVAVCSQLLLR